MKLYTTVSTVLRLAVLSFAVGVTVGAVLFSSVAGG